MKGEVLEEQLGYWRKQLAGVEALELPRGKGSSSGSNSSGSNSNCSSSSGGAGGHAGGRQGFELGEELTGGLRELSREEGVTLFMVVVAAVKVLLSRYSGQQDIAVGSPISGRSRAELEGVLGCFLNTLVLRTEVRGEESFRELV